MLTTTYEMLQKAYEGHYAVPAINTQGGTYDIIRAVCMAAEELRSPVILAHYVNTGAYSGHDWFYETAKWMAAKVSVPVAIHLDHGDSFERCMEMLKLGFTSIMFACGGKCGCHRGSGQGVQVLWRAAGSGNRRAVPPG